jgi:hypothetical protein
VFKRQVRFESDKFQNTFSAGDYAPVPPLYLCRNRYERLDLKGQARARTRTRTVTRRDQ